MRHVLTSLFAISLVCLLGVSAKAQTPPLIACNPILPIVSSAPPASATKVCNNTTSTMPQPTQADIVRSTVETLSSNGTDSASRLLVKMDPNGSPSFSLTLFDSSLSPPYDVVEVSQTVSATDSLLTVYQGLAQQINSMSAFNYYASVSRDGQHLNIYPPSSGTPVYSSSKFDENNAYTTSLADDAADGYEVYTITGGARPNIVWYDFANVSDYQNTRDASPPISGAPTGYTYTTNAELTNNPRNGETDVTTAGGVQTSVIFENSTLGPNPDVAYTTAHETGHQMDYLYTSFGHGTTTPGLTEFSASDTYTAALAVDENIISNATPCASPLIPPASVEANGEYLASGVPGLFSNLRDPDGQLICDDTPETYRYPWQPIITGKLTNGYEGLSNDQVIAKAWPVLGCYLGFQPSNFTQPCLLDVPADVFANEYAGYSGFPRYSPLSSGDGIDQYGGGLLVCTKHLADYLITNGSLPTDMASYGLSVNRSGLQSNYVIYGCDGSTTQQTYEGIPVP